MTDDRYGWGPEPLTPHERSRLRPGVDAAALRGLLALLAAAGHGGLRRLLIAHFATEMTFDDLRAAVAEHAGGGMSAGDRAALERDLAAREAELAGEWRARHPEAPPDAPVPPLPVPPGFVHVGLPAELPEALAPNIRVLWAAVDPGPRCEVCGERAATVTKPLRGGAAAARRPDGRVHIDATQISPDFGRALDALAAERQRQSAKAEEEPRIETRLCGVCARDC